MIGEIVAMLFEHPLLGFIFTVDLFLVFAIITYISLHLYREKRPDRRLAFFLKKMTLKLHPSDIDDLDSLYGFVMDAYTKKGVLSDGDGRGFRARTKILNSVSGGEKETVKAIFEYYEAKKYGGGVQNEKDVVYRLLDAFRNV